MIYDGQEMAGIGSLTLLAGYACCIMIGGNGENSMEKTLMILGGVFLILIVAGVIIFCVRAKKGTASDAESYFRSHPPRCIAGFKARPAQLHGVEFDGHPSASQLGINVPGVKIDAPEHINPVFALSCLCGADRHYVHGHLWSNPDFDNARVFLSPLALECVSCGKGTVQLVQPCGGVSRVLPAVGRCGL